MAREIGKVECRDLQGTWDWTVRHGKVSTGGWNPMLKALQTMADTGLPGIIYEELTGEEYKPVDELDILNNSLIFCHKFY